MEDAGVVCYSLARVTDMLLERATRAVAGAKTATGGKGVDC